MKEKWKLISEIKSTSKTHIKGDKYYISNKGRVKLNDIILELGKGLYVNKNKDLCIYGCKLPEKSFHRTVYKLFVGDIIYSYNYNIHHIDFNHLNNSADNLIQLTAKEHALIHAEGYKNGMNDKLIEHNKEIKRLINLPLRRKSKEFLIEYTNERLPMWKEEREQLKANKRIEKERIREQQKKEEIDAKLKAGWKYNSIGALYDPDIYRTIHTYRSPDYRSKLSNKIKTLYSDNPDYKKKISNSSKANWKDESYRNKFVGIVIVNNGKETKRIKKEELDTYISKGWQRGRIKK